MSPQIPVSMPTSRSGPASIARYGAGWDGRLPGVSRIARMRATASGSALGALRHSRSRVHALDNGLARGRFGASSAPQNQNMNPVASSYQSWLPGTA
jgi:hypothetical protein